MTQGQYAPYTLHTDAERTELTERVLARDPDKLAACHETILARRRWVQYLDACSLKGHPIKIVVGDDVTHIDVIGVERSMNVVTECFVLIGRTGLRHPVMPQTQLMVENPNV